MIKYRVIETQPPQNAAFAYEMAGDGIYLHACRPCLSARFRLQGMAIKGLPKGREYLAVEFPKVPECITREIVAVAQTVGNLEILMYLLWENNTWELVIPEQEQGHTFCRPKNPTDPAYVHSIIELHSHHIMSPSFSGQDDRDEQSFKLYGVLGWTNNRLPTLNLRLGIYGYFKTVRASSMFEFGQPACLSDFQSC